MDVTGRVAVVSGGAGGIGAALSRALAAAGAHVVVVDLDGDAVDAVTTSIGDPSRAVGAKADVTSTSEIQEVLAFAEKTYGPVDIFCANAGVFGEPGLPEDAAWHAALEINVMAHIRAARLMLPGWLERGSGYFIATASAAGLLTQIGGAPYSVTKHAAVAFAEWLAVTYGDRGVRVSCLCPMGVDTKMLTDGLRHDASAARLAARVVTAAGDVLSPDIVAQHVLEAMASETFLILPHPQVLKLVRNKVDDYDRWLRGMRRLQSTVIGAPDPNPLE